MNTLADFQPLKPAEQELLKCCQSGEFAIIGEERPTEKTEGNEIRAAFLRWLILFSKVDIDPNGIQFQGAWVSAMLDLENGHCSRVLSFKDSVFEKILFLRRATIKCIYANGSLFKVGISADGLICQGDLHLSNGFNAEGEVRFLGAKIDGNLTCTRATFKAFNEEQKALSCDGINVHGSVFLSGSHAEGEVRFLGAKIKVHCDCTQATFKALSEDQHAISFNSMTVGNGLFLGRKCIILSGSVDLTNTIVGALDDTNFWEEVTLKTVYQDGFKYGHIYGDISASFRLDKMLGKMPNFFPQPYRQLAKVLRNMGHDRDADEVMIALHDKKLELSKESWRYKAFRKLYKWTSEYGYRPMRTLKIMASVWLLFGCIYWYGANVAVFAPSNPLIFQKEYNCTIDKNGTKWLAFPKDYNESNNWYIASPAEYTTFQPFWYSLDIILPVVDLKMENDWGIVIPSPDGNWSDMIPFTTTNHFIRFLTWVETLAGWGLSLMLVAILSGLAKNEKE